MRRGNRAHHAAVLFRADAAPGGSGRRRAGLVRAARQAGAIARGLSDRFAEPALDAAGAEVDLVDGESVRRTLEATNGCLSLHEGDLDLRHLVVPEIEVANATPVVLRRRAGASDQCTDLIG